MTGRDCFAIELLPQYVDVAVLRWQAFTGAVAMLEGDGRSFQAVAAERRPNAQTQEAQEAQIALPASS
jgi:hypothetical protein